MMMEYIIQLLPLCKGNIRICSPEAVEQKRTVFGDNLGIIFYISP